MRKLFLSSVKSAIYMPTETFWRKNVLFFVTIIFLSFGDFDRGIFGTFRQKQFCKLCGKLHSTYSEDPFDENSSFQKLRNVQSVPEYEEEIPWFLFGKLQIGCRKCICAFRLQLEEIFLFKIVHFSFVLFVFRFIHLYFWPNFIGRVFEAKLHLPEEHLEERHLMWM